MRLPFQPEIRPVVADLVVRRSLCSIPTRFRKIV
jgi:hypothetical protein